MPVLKNVRHERFCQYVSVGVSVADAYVKAGFLENSGSASRLHGSALVHARIAELSEKVHDKMAHKACLSRDWVLGAMQDVALRCMDPTNFQPSPAIRALELLGKDLGLFRDSIDHNFKWNGDLSQLTEAQKAQLAISLEQVAFKDNPEGLAAWRADSAKLIEATSERIPDNEKDGLAGQTGTDRSVSQVGPARDTADPGKRIIDLPSLPKGNG